MIAVRVGDRQDIQPQDSESAQGGCDDLGADVELRMRKPSGVDEHGRPRRIPHQHGVPLPDIDHHHLQSPARGAESPDHDNRGQQASEE